MLAFYEQLVLRRPVAVLGLLAVLLFLALLQFPKIRIDASADSLLLQGDPALEYFREVGRRYSSEEFIVITWRPDAPLLSDASLQPLSAMADELRKLDGVSSVVTVLDVPLLQSPPVGLSQVTSGDPLPSLRDPEIDREQALKEFTQSPLYSNLLVGEAGDVTAIQVNLERVDGDAALMREREELRQSQREGSLTSEAEARLAAVEAAVKRRNAEQLSQQSNLVAGVREVVQGYRDHAGIFVGGVPMIAADMVSFVRNDLLRFGSAILAVMVLVLALIFRRVKWVVIPLLSCTVGVAYTLGILGFLDWRMTVISSNVVAVLLIVGLAIAIHLVVRYRELHGDDPDAPLYDRVRDTMRLMAVPCVYTGVTTMVAFVSLVVSGIQPVIDFGWMMTLGICVALMVSFSLVPALMLLWGRDPKPVPGDESAPFTLRFAAIADRHGSLVLWGSVALSVFVVLGVLRLQVENRFIDYFKESTEIYQGMELLDARLGGTIPLDIIVAAPDSSAPLPGLENTSTAPATPVAADDPFADEFDDPFAGDSLASSADDDLLADGGFSDDPFADDAFVDGDDFLGSDGDDVFAGGGAGASVDPGFWFSLEGMRLVDRLQGIVDAYNETGKVQSLSTTFELFRQLLGDDMGSVELALARNALSQDISRQLVEPYFNAERDEARITVRVKETSEDLRRAAFLRDLDRAFQEEGGLDAGQVQFTGMLVMYNNVLQSLFASQILTLGAVFAVILVMFWILFRSFSLALIALAPNLLAAGMVLGIMGFAGIPLDIMTITIAAIVVGIGVDNCIHYVYRFKREFPEDRDYLATMYRCHGSIGRAMYYTTLTLVVGFSTLTLSNFNPSLYFGVLTVIAMTAAVVGALLLLPRLILLFKPLGAPS
ncbi:efflux RND transporter permease subunit [Congregibacter litoralis]|uniref:Putative exporter of the RND superfamily n=1 Tax=Congregibacter litoralis KT71 TaxID=314285 RepID=A4AA12_9GAMM|nr:MMPL family transporter [Congregibacter litoralis]EAQ97329.1 putative exporter of the RND superfamily [Congregibacter litoralis KT71]